jgi:mannose/fructose/N-acetylgalactosamine-specific phosphotransferase system component IIC
MTTFITSLVIGFLALDTTIAFQVLISQPIFACPILGWLFGDPQLGFEVGVIMQLLWLHVIPAGAAIFPEGNIASMVTCAIALTFADSSFPNTIFTFAVIFGIIVSYLGAWMTVWDRKLNGMILKYVSKAANKVHTREMAFLEMMSILFYYILMTAFAFVSLLAADMVISKLQVYFNILLENKFSIVKPTLLGIGLMLTGFLAYRAVKKSNN